MLLLGLVVHGSQGYFSKANGLRNPELWYFYDPTSSYLMAPLCGAIHVYRMPVFFVLAGFFTLLLISKRQVGGMISNRAIRVAAPLLVAMFTIVPLIYFASEFAWSQVGGAPQGFGIEEGFKGMLCNNLYHLWFLWQLIIFYLATWLIIKIGNRLPWEQAKGGFAEWTRRAIMSNWGKCWFVAASIVFLSHMNSVPGCLDTAFGFNPPWYVLGINGLCFWYGCLLFQNQSRLKQLAKHANIRFGVGVFAVTAYLITLGWYLEAGRPESAEWALVTLSAISIWTLIEGWLAFFQKYFNTSSPLSRYIADSSYWVYLIHVPVLLVCQGMLANINLSAITKFSVAILVTTLLSFLSYHFLVRATFIGQFLNGRRYSIWQRKDSAQSSVLSEV